MVDDGRESEGGDSEQGEADGVDIGISIAALEDKIVQGATVMVLNGPVAASSTGTIGKLSSKRPERCPAHCSHFLNQLGVLRAEAQGES